MQPEKEKEAHERTRFFLTNLFRGFIWLAVIVGGYFFLNNQFDFTLEGVLGPVYDKPAVIFSIFFASEVIFGIIPPELFMIWSLRNESLQDYIHNVILLTAITYLAGIIGYYIGYRFGTTRFYATLRKNYLNKFEKHVQRFGGFLVVVAALTPLPYAGICMLMGTVNYNFRKFLIIALSRVFRFAVYAAIVWEANIF